MVASSVILAALSLVGISGAAPVQERSQTCYSGVYMIVGRGTDESPGEGKPAEVADMVVSALADSGSVAVNYPASLLDPLYDDSVSDGITNTITEIQNYVDACGSKSKIALIGYSQGGNVMTDVLAGGVDKPAPIDASYSQYSELMPCDDA